MRAALLAASVLLCGASLAQAACEPPFVSLNGKCFAVLDEVRRNWMDARNLCQQIGGDLARVDSANTFREIYKYIREFGLSADVWLGGTDQASEGDWLWTEGDRVERGMPFWGLSHSVLGYKQNPDKNKDLNCLVMKEDLFYYWDADNCANLNAVLCSV